MAFGEHTGRFSPVVAAVGLDHVRLSYEYLDRGDHDGYASLLDPAATVDEPGRSGRRLRSRGEHRLNEVFAADGRVAAVGRFVGADVLGEPVDVDFADIFALSPSGLLLRRRSYYHVDPE